MSDPHPFLHFVNTVNPSIIPNAELLVAEEPAVNPSPPTGISSAVTHQLPSPTLAPIQPVPSLAGLSAPTFIPPAPQLAYAVQDPNASKRILAYFYVTQPHEAIRTGQRKTRLVKQDPLSFGPTPIPHNVTFERLLEIIAEAIQSRPQDLDSRSIQWKPRTPANAKLQPLRDAAGVDGMLSQVFAKAKASIDYIIEIKLDPPRKVRAVCVCTSVTSTITCSDSKPLIQPWNEDEASNQAGLGSMTIPGSSSSATIDEILGFSEDGIDGSGVGPTVSKVSLIY